MAGRLNNKSFAGSRKRVTEIVFAFPSPSVYSQDLIEFKFSYSFAVILLLTLSIDKKTLFMK